jgi:tetratricopeptide (TPR) repeat protein
MRNPRLGRILIVILAPFLLGSSVVGAPGKYIEAVKALNMGQWDEAIALSKEVMGERPNFTAGYKIFIAASRSKMDLAGARAYLEILSAQHPESAHLYYALALVAKEERNYARALDGFKRAIGFDSNFAEPFVEIGDSFEAMHNLESGVKFFDDYTRANPRRANGYLGLGHCYSLKSEWDKAIKNLNKAIRLDRKNLVAYADLGLTHALVNDLSNAIKFYENALSLAQEAGDEKDQALYAHRIGNLYIGFDDAQKALEYLTKALEQSQTIKDARCESWTLLRMGEAYDRLGDWAQADQHFKKALKLHEQIKDKEGECYGYKNLGDLQLTIGEYDNATTLYRQALDLLNDKALHIPNRDRLRGMTLSELGLVSLRRDEYESALGYFNEALKLAEDLKDEQVKQGMLGRIGSIHLQTGNLEGAFAYLDQALKMTGQTRQREHEGFLLYRLGDVHLKRGQLGKAETFYDEALKVGQQLKHAQIIREATKGLGAVLEGKGDYEGARKYYSRVIDGIESERDRFILEDGKLGFFEDKVDVYAKMVNVLLRLYDRDRNQDYLRQAFRCTEQGKAQALLQKIPQG